MNGFGVPFATVPATRMQPGVLVSDSSNSYSATFVGTTHSGSP
jgi:hypothetical protein